MAEAGKGSRYRTVNKEAFEAGWDRIFGSPKADLESPCVEVCEFDYVKGVCIGCHRTLNEISQWITSSGEDKQRIMANVEERKKHAGL